MDRGDILELMTRLKLYGMRAAYDEVMTTAIKRRHEPTRMVGELLSAEIADKQARSIKYQLTLAKLPLAKEIDEFDFPGTPINQHSFPPARDRCVRAALPEPHDFRLAPCALGYPAVHKDKGGFPGATIFENQLDAVTNNCRHHHFSLYAPSRGAMALRLPRLGISESSRCCYLEAAS
jgi:IstB-like ATP binding protein